MLSVDTNILFPAMESTAPFHDRARAFLTSHQGNEESGFRRVWDPLVA